MFHSIAVAIALALSASLLSAQSRTEAHAPRALSEEQVAEALEALKSDLLLKVMPENKKRGELQMRRWLDDFHVVQTDHYLLFTNSSRTMAGKFSKGLEDIYEFVQEQFPFADSDELLTCYVFNMAEEYYNFCLAMTGWSLEEAKHTAGHQGEDRKSGKTYYATHYMSPTADVVTHEASHQIVKVGLGIEGLGSWFQEGIATYLEKTKAHDKPSAAMRTDLRNGDYLPLEEFFAMRSMAMTPYANATRTEDPALLVHRNYTHAGALIDFLVNTKVEPVAGRFPEFLKKARAIRYRSGGEASVRLIREVYGLSPAELEELWKEHHGVRGS